MRRLPASIVSLTLLLVSPAAVAQGDPSKVTIIRDEYGVPHLYAESLSSLFYGVGYVQGQDRLWQAETLRRAATGTLAEWFGPGSLASDVQARLVFGPPSRRAALLAAASDDTRTIFESFARGMNDWIQQGGAAGLLPYEYTAFGVAPREWTTDDSLAVYMLLASNFGWFGLDELANAAEYADLVARLGPAEGTRVFADTHWIEDPSARTTDPAPSGATSLRARTRSVTPTAGMIQAAAEVRARQAAAERALAELGLHKGPMSNAIVLGPRLSADGRPLLMGGPQMGYSAPQINHEMSLHGAGFEVTGMQIAGWPLLPIGVGRGYAWTLTSGGSDNSDVFVLQLNPANPGQYWYQGAWKALDCRVETFVAAGAPSTNVTLCRSVYGPVLAVAGGAAYALANSTFGNELTSYEAWASLGRVRSFAEFRQRVAQVAYNFNVFYADDAGNIAHFHAGRIPVRASGANRLFPQLGDGTADWQGAVPFEAMPHSVNPERGWLVNWNNKPGPDWPYATSGFFDWGPVHRVETLFRIVEQVPEGSATLATLAATNRRAGFTTDSPSGNADTVIVSTMLGEMVDLVDTGADPRLSGAVALLRGWDWLQTDEDDDGRYDSPAVAVFNTWWQDTLESIVFPKVGASADRTVAGNLVHRLIQGSAAALPVQGDYLGGQTIGQALTQALIAALDALTATYGTADVAAWLQPRSEIVWSPGGIGTVPNTIWMNRGTYNQLVHLGHGAGLDALNVIAPGQSGDFRSPHFADQLELYATWRYKPMRLTRDDQVRHAESVTVLRAP